jgi:hypothetical protein
MIGDLTLMSSAIPAIMARGGIRLEELRDARDHLTHYINFALQQQPIFVFPWKLQLYTLGETTFHNLQPAAINQRQPPCRLFGKAAQEYESQREDSSNS